MCESGYSRVSIVRKLLEKKIDKIHENLNKRLKVLNEELDNFEKEFAKESEKDETELNKLTQYRLRTIELFDDGDYQMIKIENRIELLKTRIEQRKLKLEFDDDLLNIKISSLGQLMRMEDIHEYMCIDELQIKYETFEDDCTPEVITKVPLSPCDTPSPIKTLPTGANRLPPPPVPFRCDRPPSGPRPVRRCHSSFGASDIRISKVDSPSKNPLGIVPKRSNSLNNRIDQIDLNEEFKIKSSCKRGAGPGQMSKAKNIAISQKTGCIFVAEKGNNRVQVFAATGEPVYSFTRKTVMPNHSMVKPYGICILNEKVFVSVTQHNCVHAYKSNGEFIAQKGQEGKGDGNFIFPTGMSTDGTNRVYVCDYGNNRVQAFSKELQFKQVIGVGNLTNPTDIAVDQHLDLYVLDRATTVVHIFNSKGVYQKKIIKIIKYPILSNPQFIAISPKGRIVLSDLFSNSVNIFTMDGGLRQTLGGPRDKELFGEPRGVAFDRNGNLVVACHKETGCLQIIEIDI